MSTLQPGSTLQNGKYEIQRVLGQGGFGITYLALQRNLQRTVVIKEFFMEGHCTREEQTHHVTVATGGDRSLVEMFYDKFFKEGDTNRAEIDEFNSNNTYRLSLEETKAKIAALDYIKKELDGTGNFVQ